MLQVILLLPRSIYHSPNLGQDDPLVNSMNWGKNLPQSPALSKTSQMTLGEVLTELAGKTRLLWGTKSMHFGKLPSSPIYHIRTKALWRCSHWPKLMCDYQLPGELTGLVSLKSLVKTAAWWAGRWRLGSRQHSDNRSSEHRRSGHSPTNRLPQPICYTAKDLKIKAPKAGAPSPAPPSLQQLVLSTTWDLTNPRICNWSSMNIIQHSKSIKWVAEQTRREAGRQAYTSGHWNPTAVWKLSNSQTVEFQGNNIWHFSCAMVQY